MKRHNFIVTVVVTAVFALSSVTSCSSNTSPVSEATTHQQAAAVEKPAANDAYSGIPNNQIESIPSDVDFEWNATDPFYGFNEAPIVAEVHIDSIAGGRTFSPISGQIVYPQTFGALTVNQSFKGEIKPGTQLNYSRVGGIVSYDDFWNGLNPEQRNKIQYLNGGQKPTDVKFVHKSISDDVDVEVGKDYLALLQSQTSKDGKSQEYSIIGFQYGLREMKGTGTNATVLNNETQEWDVLGSVVKLP